MDPMKNNNTAVLRRIARRTLAANRTRNILAVCAIILTTFMLSSVFSIGSSLIHNMGIMSVRAAGTAASIFLKNPTKDQYQQIQKQDLIEDVGLQIKIGSVIERIPEGKEAKIAMGYFDAAEWESHYTPAISDLKGKYPVNDDEIILSKTALKQLGISNPKIGHKIKLHYRLEEKTEVQDFRLSGWYTDYDFSQTGLALVSKKFSDQKGFTAEKDGRLSISCAAGNRSTCLEELKNNVVLEKGQKFDSTVDPKEQNATNRITILTTLIGMALLIVLSGYLLIYNVIYISVTKDIRFYGMLKTIGTSPKQIKRLVRGQIFRLSAIGIPAGLLLGAAASFGLVPYAMDFFNAGSANSIMPGEVSFSPWIFLASALFSLLTIAISCRKPAKTAGNVSPVEALKYTGIATGRTLKDRSSRGKGQLWRMAFHNIFRGRRRSMLVFASLFMGMITFLCVSSFIGSINVEGYLKNYVPNTFEIKSSPPIIEKFDPDYLKALSQIDGLTDMETASSIYCTLAFDEKSLDPVFRAAYEEQAAQLKITYEEMLRVLKAASDKGEMGLWINGISDRYIIEYNKTHKQQIDLKAFRKGKIAILAYDDGSAYREMLGRKLTLSAENSSEQQTIQVGGYFTVEDCNLDTGSSRMMGLMDTIFVSEAFMQKLNSSPVVSNIILDCEADKEPYVKQQIKKLNATLVDSSFEFSARSDKAAEFRSSISSLKVLGSGISILLLAVGILNFINVMLTSVYARRQELAVMESVGMTKRQIKRMLTWEGAFYALITTAVILTLGNAILYLIPRSVTKIVDYAVFQYPFGMLAILAAVMLLICLSVPRIVFRTTARESVTERLHQIDSW